MKPSFLFVSTLLCVSIIITGPRAGSAQQVQPLEPEWLQEMYREGWRKVQKGVLQRDTGGGQFETFSYGAEGLQRVINGYEQQVRFLQQRHKASPSHDLSVAIDQLKGEIDRLNGELQDAPSSDSFDGEALAACSTSYGGDAFAGPLSGSRGVTATASAYFHSDCGFQGDTFATAYAHAIQGSVETTTVRNDPKNGGAWIDSYANASASGSTGCESSAQGSVTVGALNIYYQTPYRQNFNCPPPVENTSIYTLDSTAWAQTGPGNLGPLTLTDTEGYKLIDSNYNPISTSGLPQAGIAFVESVAWNDTKLESQMVDTVSAYANASVIKLELTLRITGDPVGTSVIFGLAHYDDSTYAIDGGKIYGVEIDIQPGPRLNTEIRDGAPMRSDSGLFHGGAEAIARYSSNSFRWVWTESVPGASTGTGQWWRKVSGIWQPWGPSKPDLRRPVGHANTRVRLYANHAGSKAGPGVEFLDASITLGYQNSVGQTCQP